MGMNSYDLMILVFKLTNTEPNLIVLSSMSVTAVIWKLLDKLFLKTMMMMAEMQKKEGRREHSCLSTRAAYFVEYGYCNLMTLIIFY